MDGITDGIVDVVAVAVVVMGLVNGGGVVDDESILVFVLRSIYYKHM